MFLKRLLKENLDFVKVAEKLHKDLEILPDTYCIDMDMLEINAKNILKEANKYGITLYYMLKQIGRNPLIAKKLENIGYKGAVCVDFKEAEIMMENNLHLGNVGHLVQIPQKMIKRIIEYGTDVFTVYSIDMIQKISDVALNLGKVQDIIIRVIEFDSNIYVGQESGLSIEEIKKMIPKIKSLKGIRLIGLTSFPCFLYSNEEKKIKETTNLKSLLNAREILLKEGFDIKHINMPSITTVENMKVISEFGGTHAEPGHALTGTTPLNSEGGIEIPSYLYISEISHIFGEKSYFYGGGYYPRSNMKYGYINGEVVEVDDFNSENIDYYLSLKGKYDIFKSIILAFRTQVFVTRSDIVLIEGIHNGNIKILGRFDSHGIERRI